MKFLLIAIFPFLVSNLFAQTDTVNISEVNSIWKTRPSMYPLKRGFYESFEEFLNNAPSLKRTFALTEKLNRKIAKQGVYVL